ncbi:hypothetical protein EDD86DRAFT_249963 [Gorgonomyces haynaldii]|nr:hypothetical protein EDD86DRAFT_249963 [Gorgonomyces haynaldii]
MFPWEERLLELKARMQQLVVSLNQLIKLISLQTIQLQAQLLNQKPQPVKEPEAQAVFDYVARYRKSKEQPIAEPVVQTNNTSHQTMYVPSVVPKRQFHPQPVEETQEVEKTNTPKRKPNLNARRKLRVCLLAVLFMVRAWIQYKRSLPENIMKEELIQQQKQFFGFFKVGLKYQEFTKTMQQLKTENIDVLKSGLEFFKLVKKPNQVFLKLARAFITVDQLMVCIPRALEILLGDVGKISRTWLWDHEREIAIACQTLSESPNIADQFKKYERFVFEARKTIFVHFLIVKSILYDIYLNPFSVGVEKEYSEILDHNYKALSLAMYRAVRYTYHQSHNGNMDPEFQERLNEESQEASDPNSRSRFYRLYDKNVHELADRINKWVESLIAAYQERKHQEDQEDPEPSV